MGILKSGCSDNFHFFCINKVGNLHKDIEPSVCKHVKNLLFGEIFILNMIDSGCKFSVGIIFHIENRDLVFDWSSKINDNLQYGYSFRGRHDVNPLSEAVDYNLFIQFIWSKIEIKNWYIKLIY